MSSVTTNSILVFETDVFCLYGITQVVCMYVFVSLNWGVIEFESVSIVIYFKNIQLDNKHKRILNTNILFDVGWIASVVHYSF